MVTVESDGNIYRIEGNFGSLSFSKCFIKSEQIVVTFDMEGHSMSSKFLEKENSKEIHEFITQCQFHKAYNKLFSLHKKELQRINAYRICQINLPKEERSTLFNLMVNTKEKEEEMKIFIRNMEKNIELITV